MLVPLERPDFSVRFAVGAEQLRAEIVSYAKDIARKLGMLDPKEKRELDDIVYYANKEMFQKAIIACGAFDSYLRRADAPADAKSLSYNKIHRITDLYKAYR